MSDVKKSIIDERIKNLQAIREHDTTKKQLEAALAKNAELEAKLKDYETIRAERDQLAQAKTDLGTNAFQVIEEILDQLDKPDPAQRVYRKEVMGSGLPEKVEQHIEKQVSKRIIETQNQELIAIYNAEAVKQVNRLLEFWPKELGMKTQEKDGKLRNALLVHPFVALKGKWQVKCDSCPIGHNLNLATEYDVARFIKTGSAKAQPHTLTREGPHAHAPTIRLESMIERFLIRRALS